MKYLKNNSLNLQGDNSVGEWLIKEIFDSIKLGRVTMNKFVHVILGIILWLSVFLFLFLMISHLGYLVPGEQFFYIGFIILLSVINQSILFFKMYFTLRYCKNKVKVSFWIFSGINLCFIAFILFYITILFLFN